MKVLLEINENIIYSGMIRERNRLIAIMSRSKFEAWYLQNFITLIMYDNKNIHCYDTTFSYDIFDVYEQVIDVRCVAYKDMQIEKLEAYLRLGNYVIACCDHYYLVDSKYYGKQHFYGEILIYGFDSDEQYFFYHTSEINKSDYGLSTCNYKNFLLAIEKSIKVSDRMESKNWQINFGHPFSIFRLKDANVEFNIKKAYNSFNSLLQGKIYTIQVDNNVHKFKTGTYVFDGIYELWISMSQETEKDNKRAIWCIKLLSGYIKNYKNIVKYMERKYNIKFNASIYDMCECLSQRLLGIYVLLRKFYLVKKVNENELTKQIFIAKREFVDIVKAIVEDLENYLFEEIR